MNEDEDEDTANNIKQQRSLHKIIEIITSRMPLIHIVMSPITTVYLSSAINIIKKCQYVVECGMFNVCV